jgi:hypothetical protein
MHALYFREKRVNKLKKKKIFGSPFTERQEWFFTFVRRSFV